MACRRRERPRVAFSTRPRRAAACRIPPALPSGTTILPPRRRTELLAALGLVPLVLALLVLQAMELRSFAQRQIGIVLGEPEEAPGTVRILDVAPGLPADRAGVRAGDLLRSVNGYPVSDL